MPIASQSHTHTYTRAHTHTHTQPLIHTQASEANDPTKTDTTRVQITIFDINDHSPVFVESAYYVNVSESQALESVLVTVAAMDRDFVSSSIVYCY